MLFYKLYSFVVTYVDGQGNCKSAVIKTRDRDEEEPVLLHAAMDQYGDCFAQAYLVKFFSEERKLSLFDSL